MACLCIPQQQRQAPCSGLKAPWVPRGGAFVTGAQGAHRRGMSTAAEGVLGRGACEWSLMVAWQLGMSQLCLNVSAMHEWHAPCVEQLSTVLHI